MQGRELLRLAEMEVERTRRVLELEKVALEEEARTVEEQARQVGRSHLECVASSRGDCGYRCTVAMGMQTVSEVYENKSLRGLLGLARAHLY